jgi:group II intron reverse transcriptase/maturase
MKPLEGKVAGRFSPTTVSTKLQRIAKLARTAPTMVLTTLAHHVDVEFLHEAYRRVRKDGAPGVDGQTAASYEQNLEANLQALLGRFKAGTYRAPPVRRVHIPKGDGSKTRPIGVPTFEDKILQRAVGMVLEAVYEEEFLSCSYGFRPGRSPHQAVAVMRQELMALKGGWVVEADIRGFFDNLDHGRLRGFLDQRVRDGVLRRSVDKWLKAGVLEDGVVKASTAGTPQGGVISPLLANVYLHEVLDKWFEFEIKPRLEGRASLVRYADDFVIVFSSERDAQRVWAVLPKRFERFGLDLHPEKSGILPFGWPPREQRGKGPGSFDFLGFTHYWARSRRGNWVVKRKTIRSRLARALRVVNTWCRQNRHRPVPEQAKILGRKIRGHCAYYGITGNADALASYHHWVKRIWRKWLDRRSHKARMNWARFGRLLERHPLPKPLTVHSALSPQRRHVPRSRMR